MSVWLLWYGPLADEHPHPDEYHAVAALGALVLTACGLAAALDRVPGVTARWVTPEDWDWIEAALTKGETA
jgi:hypothetical protein